MPVLTEQETAEVEAATKAYLASEGHTVPVGRQHFENLLKIIKRLSELEAPEPPTEPTIAASSGYSAGGGA